MSVSLHSQVPGLHVQYGVGEAVAASHQACADQGSDSEPGAVLQQAAQRLPALLRRPHRRDQDLLHRAGLREDEVWSLPASAKSAFNRIKMDFIGPGGDLGTQQQERRALTKIRLVQHRANKLKRTQREYPENRLWILKKLISKELIIEMNYNNKKQQVNQSVYFTWSFFFKYNH